jgi:pimeloyl-ACP methyl ester carboxylesterase
MPSAAATPHRPPAAQLTAANDAGAMHDARTLRLPDGRTLAWRRYGAPHGRPLYFLHGFPSSSVLASLVHEPACAADICLVAPDRPGFGHSTLQRDRTLGDCADDVAHLADRLGHDRFGVLGVSCGGPYALACARALRGRVGYVGLMAGMGPMDAPGLRRGQLAPLKVLFGLARVHASLATPILRADAWLFRRDPARAIETLASLLGAPDRALLAAHADVRERFCASFVDAYRQGIAGARCEATLIARLDRGLLQGVEQTVHVYQGGLDRHVPPDMGRHIALTLPAARLHFFPDEGHLSILVNRFADCAAHLQDTSP